MYSFPSDPIAIVGDLKPDCLDTPPANGVGGMVTASCSGTLGMFGTYCCLPC